MKFYKLLLAAVISLSAVRPRRWRLMIERFGIRRVLL